MKNTKRLLAAMTASLLALTPLAATGIMTASAASITINKVADDTASHNYTAYPIITGNLSLDGATLTAMQWNNNIDLDELATRLKALSTKFNSFSNTTTPEQFVNMLDGFTDYEGLAKAFNGEGVLPSTGGTSLTAGTDSYTATGLTAGWYIVQDKSATGQLKSANILEVIGDDVINPKFSLPTLEKKITDADGSNPVDANTAAIGDTVYYKITSAVPDLTGYDKYFFIVNDTLSSGLTYNADSLVVKIGENTLTKDDSTISPSEAGKYYVTTEADTKIKVVFEDFLNYIKTNNIAKGTAITVTYNATLDSDASIDPAVGNPNTASLTYSNNPNFEGEGSPSGTPDEPTPPPTGTPSDIVGETPQDKVNTYTTAIKIKKVDQNGTPLTGATFTLTGSNLNKVKRVSGVSYTIDDANGTYWKLKTGSFTNVDPETAGLSDEAKAKYANDNHKYSRVEATETVVEAVTDSTKSITQEVDSDGFITFYGLNAGDYTLKETGIPDGYNKAADVGFTLAAGTKDENSATWTNSNNNFTYTNNEYTIQIENKKGSTLPSTGGMGTKLLYIFGSVFAIGSATFIVTRKRVNNSK